MEVLDYHRCFTINTSAVDGEETNTCRTQILAKCDLVNEETGEAGEFFLGKACIGEHMYMEGGIAQVPTSEVCVVFSEDRNMLLKRFADHGNDVIQIGRLGEKKRLFDGRYAYGIDLQFDLKRAPARRLENPDEIIQATLGSEIMVGRTTLQDEESHWRALIEFPVVYMNVHPPAKRFQVDVGPVLFPDFNKAAESLIARLELAYVLFNEFDQVEFAVRVPTRVAEDQKAETLHYSRVVYLSARNELFSLDR